MNITNVWVAIREDKKVCIVDKTFEYGINPFIGSKPSSRRTIIDLYISLWSAVSLSYINSFEHRFQPRNEIVFSLTLRYARNVMHFLVRVWCGENKSKISLEKLIEHSITANGNTNHPRGAQKRRGCLFCRLYEGRTGHGFLPEGFLLLSGVCCCNFHLFCCLIVVVISFDNAIVWFRKKLGYFPRLLASLTSCDFIKACHSLKFCNVREGETVKGKSRMQNVTRSSNSHSFN